MDSILAMLYSVNPLLSNSDELAWIEITPVVLSLSSHTSHLNEFPSLSVGDGFADMNVSHSGSISNTNVSCTPDEPLFPYSMV